MSKFLIAVLTAVGFLSACTINSGPLYTAHKVSVAGQGEMYRVNCSGLFESDKACMAAAVRICKDQPVTLAQALDNQPNGQGINNPREITFMCGTPPAPAPAPVAQAPAPAPAPAPMPAPAPRHVVLQGDTNFATGSATLTATAQRQLNDFLAASQGAHFTNTQISGYTDSTGSAASNQRLSQARAESVARYLGARGLQSDKIVAQGFGASNPVASNSTAEGRAQNRRVEINVTATQ